MKKEDAKLWVKALRSGEYEQGKTQLHCGGEYCCLGVLNKILPIKYPTDGIGRCLKDNGLIRPLGHRKDRKSIFIEGSEYTHLAEANDQGVTFEQIADYIEENYKSF